MVTMRQRPSVVDFTKLLNAMVTMKHYSVALSLFDEMRELGISINENTVNTAINCYCLQHGVNYAFSILSSFFNLGCEPHVTTFNTLLKGFFLQDQVAEAEKWFKKLLREKLCEPNEVMFLTVINCLCKVGNTLPALDLLGLLEKANCKLHVAPYNTIINSVCKDRMVDDSCQFLSQMIEKGISPAVITCNSMVQGLCNFGRYREVKDLLSEMGIHMISPNVVTFSILVDAFCKEGMVEEAEDVMEIMKRRNVYPPIVMHNALMDGYCLRGQMDKAIKVFDSLVDRTLSLL